VPDPPARQLLDTGSSGLLTCEHPAQIGDTGPSNGFVGIHEESNMPLLQPPWDKARDKTRLCIESFIRFLQQVKAHDCQLPPWDPQSIADTAAQTAAQEVEARCGNRSQPSQEKSYVDTLQKAAEALADQSQQWTPFSDATTHADSCAKVREWFCEFQRSSPDWGEVLAKIESRLLDPGLPVWITNDAGEIAGLVCEKAIEKWDRVEERNWRVPGYGLALGVAKHLVKRWYPRRGWEILLHTEGDGASLLDDWADNGAPDPAAEGLERVEPADPDKDRRSLPECMDAFLEPLPRTIQAAFIARYAFDVPELVCWEMIKHSPACCNRLDQEPRNAWYKVFGPIRRALAEYLWVEGWLRKKPRQGVL